ncbi:hypothetical protein [Halanaerobacter jeridensis]|uniref:LPS-assembly protein n=1 Tax=Halanaerobacter jeridensis TaxID=706427 RepID=A0A938XPH0_9FIRM|nr:hypothetical protein [Halanaerobacter jeridensis]MBM7556948.1 LPS-assembly protein [Halanaerobacter jeridensis]
MKKAIIFYIILIIFISTPLAGAAEGQAFTINADGYVVFDEANNLIKAQDNVVIKFGTDEIRADKVVANVSKQEIEAVGNVVLIQAEQILEGSKLQYNYQTQEGKFYDAASENEGMYFSGEVINIQDEQLLIEGSGITACQYDDPHYEIKAEEIEVTTEGKIIATGVELWVKGNKLMPLPKYVTHTDKDERKKYAVPEPEIGYNNDDSLYLEVDYDHYINEDLEGHIFAKVARESTDVLELDYLYQPNSDFELDSYLDYNRKFGLGGNIVLNNQFGSTKSRLELQSFFEEDEDDADYKEESTRASWDLKRQGPDLSLRLRRDADDIDQKMDKKLIITDEMGDYYWRVQGSEDSEENYKPEVWLGTKNRKVVGNTKLSTNLKVGQIYEPETNVETIRKQFNLHLDNNQIELSDGLDLYWHSKYSIADYDTEDQYQTYDFNLGSKQDFWGADLNLDYHYFNTAGETPFTFDQLTDPELGERHYISARLRDEWQANEDLAVGWELRGNKSYYELEQDYHNFGMVLSSDYQINEYHNLEAAYRYQIKGDSDNGVAPIERDETEWQNELRLTYKFVTEQKEFPYWDVEINTLYDFAAQEDEDALEELELDFTRQFDCFNVNIGFDLPEQGIDFGVDLKY